MPVSNVVLVASGGVVGWIVKKKDWRIGPPKPP
jgi:hypothetical protein